MRMSKVYTKEELQFFYDYIPGHTQKEVVIEFEKRFNKKITESKVRSLKINRKIRSCTPKGSPKGESLLFPRRIREFIRANNKGRTCKEITELVNTICETNYTPDQIHDLRVRMGIKSGLTGRFEKGHVSHNKGKKGLHITGCEKTWFKKGHRPVNKVEIGAEAITTNGYIKVKVAEPNKWRFKSTILWEYYNGPIPEGCLVTYKDGNRLNCVIDNLILETKQEHIIMNNKKLRSSNPEITEASLMLIKVQKKIMDLGKNGI